MAYILENRQYDDMVLDAYADGYKILATKVKFLYTGFDNDPQTISAKKWKIILIHEKSKKGYLKVMTLKHHFGDPNLTHVVMYTYYGDYTVELRDDTFSRIK